MKAVIVGAGRLGTQFAAALVKSGAEVTLVDRDEDTLAAVSATVPAARLVAGDACEPYILEEAGVLNADLLAATTGEDEDNLVISLLAKRQFAVTRVAARINDADNSWLFDSRWGVDAAVPGVAPLVSLIEEATGTVDTVSLLRLATAGVNLIETAIGPRSKSAGLRLADVRLPVRSVVAAVVRNHTPTVPDPDFVLETGDELLIVSQTASDADIHAAFQ